MPRPAALAAEMPATVRPRTREWRWFLFVVVCGVLADRATKDLVGGLPLRSVRHLVGPLSVKHVENPGIGIGFLAAGRVIPIVIGLVIFALVVCFSAWGAIHPVFPAACGVAVAGCAGNLVDRLLGGRVTDFVALGHLPVFNLADVFILGGFAVLVGSSIVVDFRDEALASGDDRDLSPARLALVRAMSRTGRRVRARARRSRPEPT